MPTTKPNPIDPNRGWLHRSVTWRPKALRLRFFIIIAPLLLFVLTVAAVSTSRAAYHHKLQRLDVKLAQLIANQALIISHLVASGETKLVELVLAGAIADPDIDFVQVKDTSGNVLANLGRPSGFGRITTRRIRYTQDGKFIEVGSLSISISYDAAYGEMVGQLYTASAVFLLAMGAIWLGTSIAFRRMIGQPLDLLLGAIRGWRAGRPITLPANNCSGEFSTVTRAFADLQSERLEFERELLAVRRDLEDRVRERTEEMTEARDRAERANRARADFLATVSHEIRTPMNAILGVAQALSRTEDDATKMRQIQVLLESGKTLTTLLDDVLDQAKIEADRLEIVPTDVDLMDLVGGVIELWRPQCREKGIEIACNCPDERLGRLRFDPVRVRQCISNLLSNAIKFTERGKILVDVAVVENPEGDFLVTIAVADPGTGIAPDIVPKLFKPFTQADNTTTRRFGGTGLGLVITRRLARMMGGDVRLDTELGKGSTFTLSFVAEAAERPGTASGVPATMSWDTADLHGRRILVVDDVATNRFVVAHMLVTSGAEVVEVADGRAALEALRAAHFDLVLLDLHMPGMDGFETLARIRKLDDTSAAIPVIIMTADTQEQSRARLGALQVEGYLEKPLEFRHALAEINRVVDALPHDEATVRPAAPIQTAATGGLSS